MRPGERDADDGDRQQDRGEEMAERQPPAGEHEPDQIAGKAEKSGADILAAGIVGARHRLAAERQERIGRDVERRPGPGQADDGDRHDHAGNHPGERHPQAAEDDPENVQEQRDRAHGVLSRPKSARMESHNAVGQPLHCRAPRKRGIQ